MRVSTTLIFAALCITGLASFTPAVGAVNVLGCPAADANGDNSVVVPPGGLFTNFQSDCVHIKNGGSVSWTNLEPGAAIEAHGAKAADDCWQLGKISTPGGTESASFTLAGDGLVLLDQHNFDGTETPNECGGVTDNGDGTFTIDYVCQLHGAAMSAKIIVDL